MRRSSPLIRRTPLRRTGGLRHHPRKDPVSAEDFEAAIARQGGRCIVPILVEEGLLPPERADGPCRGRPTYDHFHDGPTAALGKRGRLGVIGCAWHHLEARTTTTKLARAAERTWLAGRAESSPRAADEPAIFASGAPVTRHSEKKEAG